MNNHIILSCHEDDHATMATLLAGMEAHSDFVTADMNELWRQGDEAAADAVADAMGIKPKRDAWHGFTYPDFPWHTLISLLNSAAWKKADLLLFIILNEMGMRFLGLQKMNEAFTAKTLE